MPIFSLLGLMIHCFAAILSSDIEAPVRRMLISMDILAGICLDMTSGDFCNGRGHKEWVERRTNCSTSCCHGPWQWSMMLRSRSLLRTYRARWCTRTPPVLFGLSAICSAHTSVLRLRNSPIYSVPDLISACWPEGHPPLNGETLF